jgi:hypothetical protein
MSSPALDGNAVAITVQAIPGAACSGPAPGAFKPNTSRQINPESQTIGDKEKCHMIRSLHPGCERCHMADQRDMLIERQSVSATSSILVLVEIISGLKIMQCPSS